MHLFIVIFALICTKPAPVIQSCDGYPPKKAHPLAQKPKEQLAPKPWSPPPKK